MLKLFNTLTRTKEKFKPMQEGKVNIYVCGMTVYDHCHLGHARSMVCFDVITRFLRSCNYEVKYVRNITDIDDKIINRANELGQSINELTEKYIAHLHDDERKLQNLSPDSEPRATENIENIVNLISKLIELKHAYVSDNGDVCFEVASFADYGKLSHKDLDKLISGARIEIVDSKRSPLDFVLWKKAKAGEPAWHSPWGDGRPGWHIECSAMALHELGEQFDIHGGGLDLQFPHHENEIAQSEAACCKPFANYWMHVGMLQINNEKMAKSKGNFFTIQDVLAKYHPEVIRYFLLSSHYRSPLNYNEENIKNSGRALVRFYQALKGIDVSDAEIDMQWVEKFNAAMEDDINTPIALATLFELSHEVNKTKSKSLAATLFKLADVIGILQEDPDVFLQTWARDIDIESSEIEAIIEKRVQARKNKNWQLADQIRNDLLEKGIELEDTPAGTVWRLLV